MASAASSQPSSGPPAAGGQSWQQGSTATPRPGRGGGLEHAIGQRSAGVARHDDVAGFEGEGVERHRGVAHDGEARPRRGQRLEQRRTRRRGRRIDDHPLRRTGVEQEHDRRQQPVSAGDVDDAAAAAVAGAPAAPSPTPRTAPCAADTRRAHTARPSRSNSASPGKRPRSCRVRRFFEDDANVTAPGSSSTPQPGGRARPWTNGGTGAFSRGSVPSGHRVCRRPSWRREWRGQRRQHWH